MARTSTGKSVSRAAATGGGTSYRGQMPVNWYAALVVIVLLGIGSVALARYHYAKSPVAVQPVVGQTWHAALSFDICGTVEPVLPASPSTATGLTTSGDGVVLIAPTTSAQAGNHATLGKFATSYTGLTVSNTSVHYPGGPTYKNGEKCAAGTPDAGKIGVVRARTWLLATTTSKKQGSGTKLAGGGYSSKPASLKFENRQLITVGFGPASKELSTVPATSELALLQAVEGTSAPVTTTTTAPTATTTTTAPSATTTTRAPTTTTTQQSSTTTTKPSG